MTDQFPRDAADDLGESEPGGGGSAAERDAFAALNAYAETGDRADASLSPLFQCLDRLAALGDEGDATLPSSDPPSHTGLPSQLGDYEVGECLGRGGMGAVYRGRHMKMGHAVAIKVIPGDTANSPEVIERFYQEARAAAGEEHPNVVAVRHVEQEASLHYLVMDLVEGPTLSEKLLEGPLEWRSAVSMMLRVADALQHLHERGVVHRDLKPSNILLDRHGRPYVTDFGLAKLAGAVARTQSRALVGTPRYMSPEQASGKAKQVGPESDVFAFGGILYECLTGRPAFNAEHPLDAVLQVIETEPIAVRRLVKTVPRDLERVVIRCLEKDRESRYGSARQVADDLQACLAGEPLAKSRTSPLATARRIFRGRPAILLRVIGVGMIAIIVQLSYFFVDRGASSPSSADKVGDLLTAGTLANEHYSVISVLGGWLVASLGLHLLWRKRATKSWVPFAWAVVDAGFLTWTLAISRDALESPSIGYACLVAVAGVWLRQSVVWFTAAVAAIGYVVLHQLHEAAMPHYPVIFLSGLGLVALATAYQVQRVRWLTAVAETSDDLFDA